MPRSIDLMGLGFSAAQAEALGNTPTTITVVANGTSQAAATVIPPQVHCALFTPATSAAGIILSTNALIGSPVYVNVVGGTVATGTVYCPVSGTMNGSTNGSVVMTTGKTAMFLQTSQSVWVSFPLAP